MVDFRAAKEESMTIHCSVARSWQDWVDKGAAERSNVRESKKKIRRAECVIITFLEQLVTYRDMF